MRHLATALFLAFAALAASADPPTRDQVLEWIAQLADDDVARREAAQARLMDLDDSWKPALREAFAAATDAEARARLANILESLSRPQWIADFPAALEKARAANKPLLVLATPGAPDGFA